MMSPSSSSLALSASNVDTANHHAYSRRVATALTLPTATAHCAPTPGSSRDQCVSCWWLICSSDSQQRPKGTNAAGKGAMCVHDVGRATSTVADFCRLPQTKSQVHYYHACQNAFPQSSSSIPQGWHQGPGMSHKLQMPTTTVLSAQVRPPKFF